MSKLQGELGDGFFGWGGLGGSIFEWHPELEIGFAFVPNYLLWFDLANLKACHLAAEVKRCAEKIAKGTEQNEAGK